MRERAHFRWTVALPASTTVFLAGAVVAFNGCSADSAPATYTVRDSAGIEIVESSAPAWRDDEAWMLDRESVVEIGVQAGAPELLFSGITGVVVLEDGRIAVADRTSNQVRFFTPDGVFLEAFGRSGEGPGEFQYVRALGRCGADSLFVFDLDYRMVVLDAAGNHVREGRPYDLQRSLSGRPYSLSCSRNGHFAAVGWEARTGPPTIGFYTARAPVWILQPIGTDDSAATDVSDGAAFAMRAELGTFLSSERIGHENGSGPHPFGRSLVLAITDDALYLGEAASFELTEFTLDGAPQRIIRGPTLDLEIRADHLEAYRVAQLENAQSQNRPTLERYLRDLPLPPGFPAYTKLLVDPAGALWIRRFAPPGDDRHVWSVFDEHGVYLGDVDVPIELEITEIGSDHVAGVATDELGVERARVYRLLKPTSL